MSHRWYIVHVYSGMEKSVQKTLQDRITRAGLEDQFGRILVPSEKVEEIRSGQKAVMERRLYPGYIFVEMLMNDETWHLVKNTSKVSGFIGGTANRPSPVPPQDMDKIFSQMEDGDEKPRPKTLFNVGELVRVKEGPFADFNGNVEEVNYDKNTLRVSVTFFDRSTPVELDFSKVEKV